MADVVSMTPTLAPRAPRCAVCTLVASPIDVTIRLYSPTLDPLPLDGAIEYLTSVGIAGTRRMLQAKALQHRHHIDRWMAKTGGDIAPAQIADGVSHITAPVTTGWVDANQQGIDAGAAALKIIGTRLDLMADKDVIAVAKMGQGAAAVRAVLELKGAIRQAEEINQIASGFDGE